jgi:1-aminocyclopropane-1-carboxylate deaminase/D-cysteine desulfhydrase-like pyridoxal-dependent ACC family enzyme
MAVQYEYEFCDATSIVGDNNSLTRGTTNLNPRMNNNTHLDAWGSAANAQIGGMTFVVEVTTALTNAMSAVVYLASNTTNTLVSGTYHCNVAIPANAAVGSTYRAMVPAGTQRKKFLGVVVVGTGNIAAGNINAFLTADKGHLVD